MRRRHRVRAALATLLAATLAACPGGTAAGAAGDGEARVIYAGGGEVYLVDADNGVVQWLDPVTLTARGDAQEVGGAIGRPVVDASGVLWAPMAGIGHVAAIHRNVIAEPVKIAGPDHTLHLTLAGGRLAATDPLAAQVTVIENGERAFSVQLKSASAYDDVSRDARVPARTESSLVPIHDVSNHLLHVVDLLSRSATAIQFNETMSGRWADPQAVRNQVYMIREEAPREIKQCGFSFSRQRPVAVIPIPSEAGVVACRQVEHSTFNRTQSGPVPTFAGPIEIVLQLGYVPPEHGGSR